MCQVVFVKERAKDTDTARTVNKALTDVSFFHKIKKKTLLLLLELLMHLCVRDSWKHTFRGREEGDDLTNDVLQAHVSNYACSSKYRQK